MTDPRHPTEPDHDLPLDPDLPVRDPRPAPHPMDPPQDSTLDPPLNGPPGEPSTPSYPDPWLQEDPPTHAPRHEHIPPEPPRRSPVTWIVVALVLAALLALAAWLVFQPGSPPEPVTEPTPVTATPEPEAPPLPEPAAEVEVPPIELPPLEDSDPVVSELVGQISSNPRLVSWLANDFLVRRFVASVVNLADGESPRAHVPFVAPTEGFVARRQGNSYRPGAGGYERYGTLTTAFTSLDPAGASRAYRQLSPLIEEAYRDLGAAGSFDDALARAMGRVLRVPVPDRPPELVPKGLGYAYADPRLEGLPAAEKQLLRLGPDNLRQVQAQVRTLADALGIEPR